MVGDRIYDINGARANCIPSLAVMYGYEEDEKDLLAAEPAFIVENPYQILDIISHHSVNELADYNLCA
ncbi:MAG: HAD hydrolase-like protein [Oligoflexia bacterium]|nr:HAD hydrolase-like protein [Oligoflexia bacterium]